MANAPAGLELARRALGGIVVLAALCGGCASRFRAEMAYVARGFTRGPLQGRTVAGVARPAPPVVPPPAPATAPPLGLGPARRGPGLRAGVRGAGRGAAHRPPPHARRP